MFAQRLAARGYDLLLVARREDRLKAIATELHSRYPVQVHVLAVDLADPDGLAKASERISADTAITMLVNNAGTSSVEPVAQVSVETITNLIALNVTALTVLTKAVLANFIQRNAGTIINIGSVVGFTGFGWVPVYGGSKAYVQNFTQGLKLQLADTKIRFQYVAPAGTVSEIWDVVGVPMSSLGEGALMDTEACVDAALKGLDNGEFITAPSVQNETLLQKYVEASETLLAASQQPQPAPRYTSRS